MQKLDISFQAALRLHDGSAACAADARAAGWDEELASVLRWLPRLVHLAARFSPFGEAHIERALQ